MPAQLKCQYCLVPTLFSTSEDLDIHVKRHYRGDYTYDLITDTYQCRLCLRTVHSEVGIKVHIVRLHKKKTSTTRTRANEAKKTYKKVTQENESKKDASSKVKLVTSHKETTAPFKNQEQEGQTSSTKVTFSKAGKTAKEVNISILTKFKCRFCYKLFETSKKLSLHLDLHHSQDKKSKHFKCSVCHAKYATKPGLDRHVQSHSPSYKPPPRMNQSACCICHLMFTTSEDLARHQQLNPDGECIIFDAKVSGSNPEKRLRCIQRMCSEKFSTRQALEEHMKCNHLRNSSYKCKFCKRICRDNYDLKRHEKRNHTVNQSTGQIEYTCKYPGCFQTFSQPTHKESHELASHVEHVVECQGCGRKFENKSELEKHGRVHSEERPHNCKHCGKAFKNKGDANRCERLHTGQGVYKCRICLKMCRDKGVLNKHERSHMGLKAFPCHKCGKYLGAAYSLKMHMRTHAPGKRNEL